MPTLQSPGTIVSVIDESFYTPATPGTVPMIFVATAANKSNASKTGTAAATLAGNAGQVYTVTSQRDLTDLFGTPKFYTDVSGNPVHGGELNEYGLQAAYSLLGVSSKAYIVRADVDLSQLEAKTSAPTGSPISGQHWVDTSSSIFGISEWDATNKVFVNKTPIIINDENVDADTDGSMVPKASIGTKGSYAIVVTMDNTNAIYYKNNNNKWVLVGSNYGTDLRATFSSSTFDSTVWQTSHPVAVSSGFGTVVGASTFTINGQTVTIGSTSTSAVATTINNTVGNLGVGAKVNSLGKLELYADINASSNGINGVVAVAGNAVGSLGLTTGTYSAVALSIQPHYQFPQYAANGNPTGSVYIKTTAASQGASWTVKSYNGGTNSWATLSAPIYPSRADAIKSLDVSGGKNIPSGSLFIESNFDHGTGSTTATSKLATFKVYRRSGTSPTTITGSADITTFTVASAKNFIMRETVAGSAISQNTATITVANGAGDINGADIVTAISGAGFENISAKLNSNGTLSINHALGGEIYLTDGTGSANILSTLGFTEYDLVNQTGTQNLFASGEYDTFELIGSNWKPLSYEAKSTAPYTDPADGTLWYSAATHDIDILVHNGTTWVGYASEYTTADSYGPILSATQPTQQVGGHSGNYDLVDGDIWIDTSVSDEYGLNVYVYNGSLLKWIKQDVTDQESPTGWLYADARWSTAGPDTDPATIIELLNSDYLDPDAPDPALYPQGMRLWNTRRSGFNIKQFKVNHIDVNENDGYNQRYLNDPMDGGGDTTPYNPDRWVTVSPNNANGSGSFGRHSQRSHVVAKLKALVDTNSQVRDTDTLVFNLIACPGYPELIANMSAFNEDRSYTAFVIGDTPFRLQPTGTELANWGNNTMGAVDNGDEGGVSYNEYMAMFYPSGYTNDNSGNNIVVPPSHMMLRTIAVSDQKSYQWFAPSGIKRGNVSNATSVGYIDNGEFKTTALPNNIRDVMSTVKINPIATLNGVGIVNFGNYTRASGTSSLDRINVSRLVAYLRRQLDVLSRPFLFEPNDRTTRNEIKNAVESLMLELVGQRALYDFIVVCDDSNNTKTRIDRSELWVDVAIEPVKAVEFIYIPLRLKNTGEIKAGL